MGNGIWGWFAALVWCAPITPEPAEPIAQQPVEFDLVFTDSSNIRVLLLEPALVVATKYGKLSVPIDEIRRIVLGFRYPEGMEQRIATAIERLGDARFREREDATRQLYELRPYSIPLLRLATKSNDLERSQRAQELLKKILADVPEEKQVFIPYDTIETLDFTIRGKLERTTLRVRTKHFGEAAVKVSELKYLRAILKGQNRADLRVDAAKYARLNWSNWLDTGIDVPMDRSLEITASGQIDQWPQTPGQYLCGPRGNNTAAPNVPANFRLHVHSRATGADARPMTTIMSGALIGKIGEQGPVFIIGDSCKLPKTPAEGRLYLFIAPSHWNNDDCTGEYKVKIQVGD